MVHLWYFLSFLVIAKYEKMHDHKKKMAEYEIFLGGLPL